MIIDKPLLVAQLINQLAQLLQGIIIGEAPTDGKKAVSTYILCELKYAACKQSMEGPQSEDP